MKKYLTFCFLALGALLLTGCGHNIANVDRGIGIDLKIPVPFSGEDIVSIRIGQIDSTSLILRGNTQFESQSETSGDASVGTSGATSGNAGGKGGITQKIKFTTGPQLNEGYLRDVLTDPNISKEDKSAMISALTKNSANTSKDKDAKDTK